MKLGKILLILMILLVLFPIISAQGSEILHEETESSLHPNIQKIIEYKNEQAQFYFKNLSFLVAFLAGILGLLTPCSLAILPAFFSYSFEGKKQITKMTLIFFLGFAPVFIIFGLLATFLGKTLATLQQDNGFLVVIAGVFLIIFGLMVLFGKGFSGISINKKTNKTTLGIFLFGMFYAVGFTACMGPILVGILLIAGVLQNYLYASFLMLFYSIGLFVPLFLISMFFDKYNFSRFVSKTNKKLGFSITNLIAGGLLIIMGLVFIIYRGTYVFSYLGLGNITRFIYSLQNRIVELKFANIVGFFILIIFLLVLWKFLKNKR